MPNIFTVTAMQIMRSLQYTTQSYIIADSRDPNIVVTDVSHFHTLTLTYNRKSLIFNYPETYAQILYSYIFIDMFKHKRKDIIYSLISFTNLTHLLTIFWIVFVITNEQRYLKAQNMFS